MSRKKRQVIFRKRLFFFPLYPLVFTEQMDCKMIYKKKLEMGRMNVIQRVPMTGN